MDINRNAQSSGEYPKSDATQSAVPPISTQPHSGISAHPGALPHSVQPMAQKIDEVVTIHTQPEAPPPISTQPLSGISAQPSGGSLSPSAQSVAQMMTQQSGFFPKGDNTKPDQPEKVSMQEEAVKDDVDKQDQNGMTALMQAAEQNDVPTVLALLGKGANVNTRDRNNKTALMWAQSEEVMRALINKGADVNEPDWRDDNKTLLMRAKSKEVVRALLAVGADVDQQDFFGNTALHYAESGDVVNALIEGEADTSIQNKNDYTAFMRHVMFDHEEAVNALLASEEVNVNTKTKDGTTALMLTEDKNVVNALVAAGADINMQDNQGKTALIQALEKGNTGLFWALLRKGADVTKKDKAGQTALMLAKDENVVCNGPPKLDRVKSYNLL